MTEPVFTTEDVNNIRAVLVDARLAYARASGLLARVGPPTCDALEALAERMETALIRGYVK